MAAKMTQEEWAIQKGWGPDYIPSNEEMAEYQAYLDAPVQEVDASEQDLNLANKNLKPDNGNITKNSLSIAQQRMRGITNKPSYSDFEEMLGSYVNEDGNLSRRDRRNFRKLLKEKGIDMSRSQMLRIGKSFNRGETNGAFNNYVNGLERNSYIKDGKLYTQGQDGYTDDGFEEAKRIGRAGTDATALVNQYNQDVINARKNAKIVYDPVTNTYKASGKVGDIEFTDQDITNADWFKNDVDRQRTAQLTAYRGAVDALDSAGLARTYGTEWGASGLATTLGINPKDLEAYNKKDAQGNYVMSTDDRAEFRRKQASALKQKLDALRFNTEGGFDFEGNVRADQITKYLIEQQKENPNAYSFLDNVSFAPGGRYASAGRATNVGGPWSHLRKNGGTLKQRAQAYKKGGAIKYAGWGTFLDILPVVGTAKQGYEMATTDRPLDWSDWASLGLSATGDALMFIPGVGTAAGAALKGTAKGLGTVFKVATKPLVKVAGKTKGGKTIINSIKKIGSKPSVKSNPGTGMVLYDPKFAAAQAKKAAIQQAKSKMWGTAKRFGAGYTVGQIGRSKWGSERDAWEEYKQQVGLTDEQPIEYITPNVISGSVYSSPQATTEIYTPNLTYTPYFSDQILIGGYKNGGTLNMNKINYFQEGGAMAPQAAPTAAPAQGGQDIQAQVMQLVQAAMNGDEQATQAIQQIMQAAQQGDQQAVQIAQMIQDVAKQMQGQATAAKYGAKLSYIKSLRSGCPEGYEVSYHKKGGVLCKECVAKSNIATSQSINNATESVVTSAYNYTVNRVNNTISGLQKQPQNETASSDITSLHKKGGCLKKKLSCGKKMQEGSKVDEAKCGTKIKAACGTKTTINKCGSKLKKKLSCGKKMQEGDKINEAKCGSKMKAACGTKATMDKCGGKAKKKCLNGSEIIAEKCGGKTKKKKCSDGSKVVEDKCGGKAKKKCLNGGFLTLENLQSAYKFANGGTILKAQSGNVLRADHVKDGLYKEERAKEEAQWNKYATASEAIKAAKKANRSWFGYKGKVYRTGAANDWANPGEIERMTQLYGANLGWTDDLKKLNGEQGKKAAEYRRNSRNQTANLSDNVTPVPAERPQRGKATERVAINSYVNPQKTEINWDFFMLPGQKTTNKQIAYRSGANKAWGDYIRKNSPNLYGKFFDSMIKAGYSYIPSSGTYVNKSGDRVFLSDGRLYSSNNRTGRRNINIRNLNLK